MIQKIRNFLRRSAHRKTFPIHRLCSSYFAVQHSNIEEIIKYLNIQNTSTTNCQKAFHNLWESSEQNVKNNKNSKIIISDKINDWNFIYWECGIFEECKKILDQLSSNANYYYADPWVDGYKWIIKKENKYIRQFEYQMGELITNEGNELTNLEHLFIKNIDKEIFIFGEDVFTSIIEKTCQVGFKNFKPKTKFVSGTIKL